MNKKIISIVIILSLLSIFITGCIESQPVSSSGVTKANVDVKTGSDGLTVEQRNIKDRLLHDNKPGSMQYLYIISSYSGQTIYTDVVKGKVTSGGKRLTPYTISGNRDGSDWCGSGIGINIGGRSYCTQEVLQDDGTYGSSMEYLFYWDTKDVYHQIYVSGGQIVLITDQPISTNGVTINVENVNNQTK